ncbi:arabinogalactan peptide 23-like [Durio zibethinus]|uniref:Arabinogalactan peptide 23-like n=1 Tax=Durio zibethinus TaxID=66656 RepID=A0A6P6AIM4_DURZI|nr:arabinogalactan peptide 23-like [Durio zibethinus]
MDMKKAACVVLFAAASMSVVMAEVTAPAPAPTATSDASATFPVVVGASIASLIAYFLH